jgi:hypothetical protein
MKTAEPFTAEAYVLANAFDEDDCKEGNPKIKQWNGKFCATIRVFDYFWRIPV